MKLHAIQAHEGDCLLLEHEQAGKTRFLLIDGGPADTYDPHLGRALEKLVAPAGGVLDLVVVSHVDGDHVTGLLELLVERRSAKEEGVPFVVGKIGDLWHNAFDEVVSPGTDIVPRFADLMTLMSALRQAHAGGLTAARRARIELAAKAIATIGQGHRLAREARLQKIPRNRAFDGKPIIARSDAARTSHGLKLRVVGPTQANLEALRLAWEAFLEAQEKKARQGKLDLLSMSDESVPNLSSVQLLVEKKGKRMLLTGDGRGDHLLEALEELELLDAGGGIDVDLLKGPHHGSDRNVDRAFFERVRARTYVVSANGKDGNPDSATLKWIVGAAKKQDRKITIALTNSTPSTEKLVKDLPPSQNGYTLRFRPQNRSWLTVSLA